MADPARLPRRRVALALAGAALLGGGALAVRSAFRFAPDTTPEGAYQRITLAMGRGDALGVFPYLEDAAQHACFTLRDYRKQASERVAAAYPEPDRARLLEAYRAQAEAPDGADVWVMLATERGWLGRLRRDMSGIERVEIDGERASVETVRGTRYPFRRRHNGIWGLALFTGELVADAERAARDFDVVRRAAEDYAREAP